MVILTSPLISPIESPRLKLLWPPKVTVLRPLLSIGRTPEGVLSIAPGIHWVVSLHLTFVGFELPALLPTSPLVSEGPNEMGIVVKFEDFQITKLALALSSAWLPAD